MGQMSYVFRPQSRRPEMADPNERGWNGVLLSVGTGLFIAGGFIVGIWFAVTAEPTNHADPNGIKIEDQIQEQRTSDQRRSLLGKPARRSGTSELYFMV